MGFLLRQASKNDSPVVESESFLLIETQAFVFQRRVTVDKRWHDFCCSEGMTKQRADRFMQRPKDTLAKWLSTILPVAILVLVGLFAVTVIRDYGRASEADRQALLEKGNVLIRALESGSRVGMGMRMHHVQQQALLEEMAGQPGVLWFAVTNAQGIIVLHSNPNMVGRPLYTPDEMKQLKPEENARWRLMDNTGNEPALEV